jgi:hypothetical protein
LKKKLFIGIVALGAILYGSDFLVLHSRQQQFGSVQVKVLYAVKTRNRQTEYLRDAPQPVSCVNSLFPQMGYEPCWYLAKHRTQTVDINAGRRDMLMHTP